MSIQAVKNDVYVDAQGLSSLRHSAQRDPDAALRTVAQKFEALFVNMMMQSMRKASESMDSGLFSSDNTRMYQGMLDSQMSVHLSERGTGLGLADSIVRQLSGSGIGKTGSPTDAIVNDALTQLKISRVQQQSMALPRQTTDLMPAAKIAPSSVFEVGEISSPHSFVEQLLPAARHAASQLGVAPEVLLAQAALETGWGKHVLEHEDGRSSHNLFNIKADHRWDGDKVSVNSLEFLGGVPMMQRSDFRSYTSFQSSFSDYVQFLQSSPRYAGALASVGNPTQYLQSLQDAGYATDPRYAEKVGRVLAGSTMNESMGRVQVSDSRDKLGSEG